MSITLMTRTEVDILITYAMRIGASTASGYRPDTYRVTRANADEIGRAVWMESLEGAWQEGRQMHGSSSAAARYAKDVLYSGEVVNYTFTRRAVRDTAKVWDALHAADYNVETGTRDSIWYMLREIRESLESASPETSRRARIEAAMGVTLPA